MFGCRDKNKRGYVKCAQYSSSTVHSSGQWERKLHGSVNLLDHMCCLAILLSHSLDYTENMRLLYTKYTCYTKKGFS